MFKIRFSRERFIALPAARRRLRLLSNGHGDAVDWAKVGRDRHASVWRSGRRMLVRIRSS
jgi:hypothetical protein